jgi:hypothetical protein
VRRRGETAPAALAAGAVLLLSACAGAPEAAQAPAQAAAPPLAATAPPPAAATLAAVAPAAGHPPELIGLTRADVARLLGAPTLLRREPPAEVWQYAGGACVLHVFIYQEVGGSRVAYYEAAQRSGRSLTARDCYDRLLAGRRGQS